jgi:peptidyl-prolyl cis-trans isomerase A (cyclophilin A)
VTVARCSAAGTSAATTAQGAGRAAVCMQTSLGEMVMELYTGQAPVTSANFLRYVDDGFFTDTLFHRVIAGFVIQGGGFVSGMVAKPATYPAIPLEVGVGLSNTRYTVAMARTNDLNSATSQFYVNLVDNVPLDTNAGGYAVFGKVISGTAVVDAIGAVATGTTNGFADVPRQDIVVTSAVRMP